MTVQLVHEAFCDALEQDNLLLFFFKGAALGLTSKLHNEEVTDMKGSATEPPWA